MRKYAFFKICVVALLGLVALCASSAQADQASWCPKDSRCSPVMEAWCRQNATVLEKVASEGGEYVYHDVQCHKLGCCVSGTQKWVSGPGSSSGVGSGGHYEEVFPPFLQALVGKNTQDGDCWLCGLLETIFVRGDVLATRLYKTMRSTMLALLGIVAALTLLWFAFRVFVDFSGKESRAFIQKSAGLFARVALVALLLVQAPNVVGELFFSPLISLTTGLGLEMLSVSGGGKETSHAHITYLEQNFDKDDSIMGCTHHEQAFWDKHSDLIFSKATCNMVVGLVQIMSVELTTPSAFGSALLLHSTKKLRWGFVPTWSFLFGGLLISIVFFFVRILLPFKVIDIFVQLVVAACFLPLAITLFAFPATRKYTQAMWKLFLACIIQLLMLSLMVALAVNLFVGGGIGSTMESLLPLFLKNDLKAAYAEVLVDGNGIITIAGLGFIAFYLIKRAASFAKQLGVSVNLEAGDTLESVALATSAQASGTAAGAATEGATTLWKKLTSSH